MVYYPTTLGGPLEKEEKNMVDSYDKLGQRISYLRGKKKYSQEKLSEEIGLTRESVTRIETGRQAASIETLIDIANALEVSADDLLVDSLKYSSSTADTEIHKLLLDCNEIEEQILIDTVKHLKATLSRLGI